MLDHDRLVAAYPRRDGPWLRANFVASLDGAASHQGRAGGLGDAQDQQVLLALRELADVVLVGAGTVRVEGYGGLGLDDAAIARRRGLGLADLPELAIVSGSLDLDPRAEVFTAPGPRPLVLTRAAAPPERAAALARVARLEVCGEQAVDPHSVVRVLAERGLTQVLCEGGPQLFASLLSADLVDELCLSLSPVLEGGAAPRIARGGPAAGLPMRLEHVLHGERMLFLRYQRQDRPAGSGHNARM